IGLGFRYLALIHIIGHACLRTLQLLRAPSLLRDYHSLENAIGGHLQQPVNPWQQWLPVATRNWLYRWSIDRGRLDTMLDEFIVRPFVALFVWCDSMERRWTDFLTGSMSRESERVRTTSLTEEDAG
ncbi:MAG: oxidoreductase, partial [Pirellulales bacterium]